MLASFSRPFVIVSAPIRTAWIMKSCHLLVAILNGTAVYGRVVGRGKVGYFPNFVNDLSHEAAYLMPRMI